MKDGRYRLPLDPGYSIEMKAESLDRHEFPNGQEWKDRESVVSGQ
jgi:L-fuconate dehydratase